MKIKVNFAAFCYFENVTLTTLADTIIQREKGVKEVPELCHSALLRILHPSLRLVFLKEKI